MTKNKVVSLLYSGYHIVVDRYEFRRRLKEIAWFLPFESGPSVCGDRKRKMHVKMVRRTDLHLVKAVKALKNSSRCFTMMPQGNVSIAYRRC